MALNFNFTEYMETVNSVILIKNRKETSTKTIAQVIELVKIMADEAYAKFAPIDTKANLTDKSTGNIYEVYSQAYVDKYQLPNYWALVLDMEAIRRLLNGSGGGNIAIPSGILSGAINSVTVDSTNGEILINIDNPNEKDFEIFLNYPEIDINDEIEKVSYSQFKIKLFSFTSFEKIPLNCELTPIRIGYAVIFKN
jgi:hypothetical protein